MFCNALQAFHLKEIKDAPVMKREREREREKERKRERERERKKEERITFPIGLSSLH